MKVTIVGAGALGCLFAARMAHGGVQVTLVDHKSDRCARLKQNGVALETPGNTLTTSPAVATYVPQGQDLVLICVKSYHTQSLQLPGGVPVLTVQSGLGNVETLCSMVGSSHVLAGATRVSASLAAEGRARLLTEGKTCVGSWTTCPVTAAQHAFERAGLEVEITDSPGQHLWEHAIIAAGTHPLTALVGLPTRRVLELPEARQLMRDLVVEAVKVASTEGYRFPYSLVERAEEYCEQAGAAISPMLQDVQAGRRTEIEALSGEILRRAQIAALPCPRTRVLWQLVKILEPR